MLSAECTIAAIRLTMETISREFGAVGALDRWSFEGSWRCDGFYAERRLLSSRRAFGEAVLIPMAPECLSAELLGALDEIRRTCGDPNICGVVVDVFGTLGGDGQFELGRTGGRLERMLPSEVWFRLSGVREYWDAVLLQDADIAAGRREFVQRRLAYVGARRNVPDGVGLTPLPAVAELCRWADAPPAEEPLGVLIVGERGSGKTWLLRRFQDELMRTHFAQPWATPAAAFVSLREYGGYLRHRQGVRRALSHYLVEACGLRPPGGMPTLEGLISAGRIIVLLDGVDELTRGAPALEFGEQVSHLLDHIPGMARAIATTRSTKFASFSELQARFSGAAPSQLGCVQDSSNCPELIRPPADVVYRPSFDVCRLLSFDEDDTVALAARVSRSSGNVAPGRTTSESPQAFRARLSSAYERHEWDRTTIVPAILEVAQIPASSRILVGYINADQTAGPALEMFEAAMLHPLVAFNLEAERASDEIRVRVATPGGWEVRSLVLDLSARLRVLENVAAQLLEQGRVRFDESVLTTALSEVLGPTLEVVTSDLRAQTVLVFADDAPEQGRLAFRTASIGAYFLARHVFRMLLDSETRADAFRYLGRYRFDAAPGASGCSFVGILDFLRAFLCEGAIEFREGEFEYYGAGRHDRLKVEEGLVGAAALEFFERAEPYSVWTRNLQLNMALLGLPLTIRGPCGEWEARPLRGFPDDLVLVPGSEEMSAFLIGTHEVTNQEFLDFLGSGLVPVLGEADPASGVRGVRFVLRGRDSDPHPHPLSWQAVHGVVAARDARSPSEVDRHPAGFMAFTNSYHLFEWPNGRCPAALLSHPLVWPSAFVAAIYCNWRTRMESAVAGDAPDPGYYLIGLSAEGTPLLETQDGSIGYRLPMAAEWVYAARGGDENHYPWDSLLGSRHQARRDQGERLRETLLRPVAGTTDVLTSRANGYGIFGMIGNVREWAFDKILSQKGQARIMGATWALGAASFAYERAGAPLPMVNTNLDVGFRVARSLDADSVAAVGEVRRLRRLREADDNGHR